jgi:hypothetical protein
MRLTAVGALVAGYVLGTRAGRERYEQIRRLAGEAAERLEAYGASGTLAARLERRGPSGDAGSGHG